jgi:serine phosphatase RsbU (regulator of sigma subunit)/pSer/pThr/pTyr-binding forkhead associated (FHA) protein/uncharacterized C2H2 Zn-finger protein
MTIQHKVGSLCSALEGWAVRRGFVILEDDEHGKRRTPVVGPLIIGRSADCDITIDDAAASRHHVEVRPEDNRFNWKDLGSTNGTIVNGAEMLEGELHDGDTITIGETDLRFEVEVVAEDSESDESTLFKTLIDAEGHELEPSGEESKAEDMLRAVYSVMNRIATNFDPCNLVDEILDTSMRAIDAQRAAVLFAGQDGEEMLPCPDCGRYHMVMNGRIRHVNREGVKISSTVAHRVLSRGESVLFADAQSDGELNAAESIMSLDLRSIMCVPLRGKYGILGLLYVDSDRPEHAYSREDMLLTTAVGNSAGLALENARMYQQIIEKERVDQEIQHAWTIQEGFLVKEWPEDDDRFTVYGETRPAKTVGGDFYDFVLPARDSVGLLIGDVSGKGVPAALTMAQLLAEFRLAVREARSPSEVLARLNRGFFDRSIQGTFCTMSYLTVDLGTGKVVAANAGHLPALCVGRGGVREFGEASGPPLGIVPGTPWVDVEDDVDVDETLLLYTDGIVEARGMHTRRDTGVSSDEFGQRNLSRVAQGFSRESPREMVAGINLSVQEYTAPATPHDDCTMIALRYTG